MTLSAGNGQRFCVDPVSWLSTNVTAFSGHHPIMPATFPEPSRRRHSSPCTPACSTPLVAKSNAMAGPPAACTQSTSPCRHWSWLCDGLPSPS
ncbi:unnamed protein product [Alopecurus aequalis]